MTDIQVLYDGPIVKRAAAEDSGLKRYFTGLPCRNGHIDQRYTVTTRCVECKKNNSSKYRSENLDHVINMDRKYKEKNKERRSVYGREYYLNNIDKIKKYRHDNSELISEYKKKHKLENRDRYTAYENARRARSAGSSGSYTVDDVKSILSVQGNKCAEPTCRADLSAGYHVDHIMPISKGGSNSPSNIQCLCPSCNMSKGAKHPFEWAKENGRLL